MSAAALRPPSAPWLRLIALVLVAHLALLMAVPPRVVDSSGGPPSGYWTTRVVTDAAQGAVASDEPGPASDAARLEDKTASAETATPPSSPEPRAHGPTRAPEATQPARKPALKLASVETTPQRPSRRVAEDVPPDQTTPPPAPDTTAAPTPSPAKPTEATSALPPATLPAAASLTYAVSGTTRGQPYQSHSQLQWQPADGRYEAEWLTQGDAAQRQWRWHSQGLVTATGLMPERFAETTRSERAAHFDAAGGRIRFSANTPDADWSPGGQDRLSAVLQLAGLIAAAPQRYPTGSTIVLQTAGARDAVAALWTVQGDETLDVDGRAVPCTVLVHRPERAYEPITTLWLAKPLGHLPAQVRYAYAQGDMQEHRLQNLADSLRSAPQ